MAHRHPEPVPRHPRPSHRSDRARPDTHDRDRRPGPSRTRREGPGGGPDQSTSTSSTVTRTWERLPGLDAPVLALCGAIDAADHLAMADRLVHGVPDGRSARGDGTAHYPNMERPAEFDAALRAFLDTTVSPGART